MEGSIWFSGCVLSNYGGKSGITRSIHKWDRGPVLFRHKEWREMITLMQRSMGNYPRYEGGAKLEWDRLRV